MNDFFAPLINGVSSVFSSNNYNLLVAVSRLGMRDKKGPSPIGPHNTDGTLVFANSLSEEQLIDLCKIRFPVVLLYHTSPLDLKIPHVIVENKNSSQKMIDHLIEDMEESESCISRVPGIRKIPTGVKQAIGRPWQLMALQSTVT